MSNGSNRKCRLFLEGREVPFVSATLICNAGEPITAVIDLVPLQVIKFIRPKTQVHIFVRDLLNFGDLNFYLAFEGEVVGRGFGKSHTSRSFQIIATDYSNYWDEAKAYLFNPNFLVGKIEEVQTGSPAPSALAQAAGATMKSSVTVRSAMIDMILKGDDLVDGVANIVKNLSKINLFYKAAYERLRINERVRVVTSGKLKEFLKDLKMEDFLQSFTGQQGGMVSLREMLDNIMGLVFHSFVSVPFPSRVDVKPKIKGVESPFPIGQTIGNFLFVPDGYSLPPPKCNVIFPNQIQEFKFDEDFRAAPTRFAFRASFPEFIQSELRVSTYPVQYYPTSFSDYMFKTSNETDEEFLSLLGTSSILKDKLGRSYSGVKYGDRSLAKSVGNTSVSPILREGDFLTNEESIRGIFFDMETLMPSMTALAKNTSVAKRKEFTQEIGAYLFYKKRFAARNATAQLDFHPFLVPGFNSILLDDSEAGQTVIAKLQSVVHTLTHQGFATSASFGYARDYDEIDALSGGSGEPPLPKWFDKDKFGSVSKSLFDDETTYIRPYISTNEIEVRDKIENATVFNKLSGFYQSLLGVDAVTDVDSKNQPKGRKSALVTSRGAAAYLVGKFRAVANDSKARDAFVYKYVRRDIPTLADAFFFIGAVPQSLDKLVPDEFAVFEAKKTGAIRGRFDGVGYEDEDILTIRREIIDHYAILLKTRSGFRG